MSTLDVQREVSTSPPTMVESTSYAQRDALSQACLEGLAKRLKVISRVRQQLVENPGPWIEACAKLPWRRTAAETLAAELIPLCDAMRYLEKQAKSVLASQSYGMKGRPTWLWGVSSRVQREPWGEVLIIGPANYPLLLPGVQWLQAYVAGNRVSIKPSPEPGCREVMELLYQSLVDAGMPDSQAVVLDVDPVAATERIDHGFVDFVVFTGSATTGRRILAQLAEHGIPSVMELSGCDAMIVLNDADLKRVTQALRLGLRFNGSQTCIAPRRIMCEPNAYEALKQQAGSLVDGIDAVSLPTRAVQHARELIQDAVDHGAKLLAGAMPEPGQPMEPVVLGSVDQSSRLAQADVFAPVISLMRCADESATFNSYARCPYRLGASVFGSVERANSMAEQLDAGHVVVNDLIAPTADPRLPFPARGDSGFGETRGREGLLAMTQPKAVIHRKGGMLAHLDEPKPSDGPLLQQLLKLSHGSSLGQRLSALRKVIGLSRQS